MLAARTIPKLLDMADGQPLNIEDRHQLTVDIGLTIGDKRFIPLAECNSFWWQPHPTRFFIVNAPVAGDVPIRIVSRSPEGETSVLSEAPLQGLPERPKGTTRLSVHLKFLSDREAYCLVSDCGFGELFPKTNYVQELQLKL